MALAIDKAFKNSLAETLTETEKAFNQGFIAMSGAIVTAIQMVSFVVILIIMAVVANTMAMTTRERIGDYAIMKTLGFGGTDIAVMIFGESLVISLTGCLTGMILTFPAAKAFGHTLSTYFPIFIVSEETLWLDLLAAVPDRLFRGDHPGPPGDPGRHRRGTPEDRLMAVPLSYSMRNLWKRRLTTILTVSGMALVVFVFAAVLMMAAGLQKTLVETGSDDNVVVFRKGSTSEVMSGIDRTQASIVEMLPQVAIGGEGRRLVAKEVGRPDRPSQAGHGQAFQRRGPRRPGEHRSRSGRR